MFRRAKGLLPTAALLCLLLPLVLSAQERGIQAEDYYRMVSVGEVAISPNGEMVAFTRTRVVEEENRRHREVWVAPVRAGEPAGEPFRFTDPTREAWAPRWSPDGSVLSFQSRRDDEATTWFARVGPPGGEAYRIPGVKGAPLWSPDGAWIAFVDRAEGGEEGERAGWIAPDAITEAASRERFDGRVITQIRYKSDGTLPLLPHPDARGRSQIFLVPSEGGEPRQLTDVGFDVGGVEWAPDGSWLVFSGNPEGEENPFGRRSDLYRVEVEGGEVRMLTPGEGVYRAPTISPGGRMLAYLHQPGPNEPTRLEVRELGADGTLVGEARILVDGRGIAPGSPEWTADGAALRFTAQDRGSVHLFEVPAGDASAGRDAPPAVTEGERQVGSVSTTLGGEWMAYTSTDAVMPEEVFLARADGSGEVRLTGFNDEWLAEVSLRAPERLTWRVADGTEVEGWVIPPVEEGPGSHPMVLKIHGGPNAMYGHTFFQTFHLLSAAGFYVLYPNPRGSSGYGHDFMMATRGLWGLMDEEDFLTGVDAALRAHPGIDPNRIGVAGGSYGGYATNWLTARTDRFAAAVTSRSITSLETLWGTSDALGTLEHHFFGTPWDAEETYRNASPIAYVGNVTTPTLIIHSEQDHRTPMQDGEMWYLSLQRLGVPVEFVRYPRSSHGLSRTGEPWLLVDRLVRIRSWFEHWLGGTVTDGP